MAIEFSPLLPYGQLVFWLALTGLAVLGLRYRLGAALPDSRRKVLLLPKLLAVFAVLLVLLNPVRIRPIERQESDGYLAVLMDISQSMQLPQGSGTRWEAAEKFASDARKRSSEASLPQIQWHGFGSRLQSWPDEGGDRPTDASPANPIAWSDTTELGKSLGSLVERLSSLPSAVVVVSDGRVMDEPECRTVAQRLARLGIPLLVVPIGDETLTRDVAVRSVISPPRIRKRSQIPLDVLIESIGCRGDRAELRVYEATTEGERGREIGRDSVELVDGLIEHRLAIDSGTDDRELLVTVLPVDREMTEQNNQARIALELDHTNIRVLHVTSRTSPVVPRPGTPTEDIQYPMVTLLQRGLRENPEVESYVGIADPTGMQLIDPQVLAIDTRARLYAYDVIIFDNVPQTVFPPEAITWLEEFVSRRGGGLCMVGGPQSFRAGDWQTGRLGELLPVTWGESAQHTLGPVSIIARLTRHPIWRMTDDEDRNGAILNHIPEMPTHSVWGTVKPGASVLATGTDSAIESPMIVAHGYGRGRVLAIAPEMGEGWAAVADEQWQGDNRSQFDQFWANVVHWLAEKSTIGRRRLSITSDRPRYSANDRVPVAVEAFHADGSLASDCQLQATLEPLDEQGVSPDDSPFVDPATTTEGSDRRALIPWGEPLTLVHNPGTGLFELNLRVADANRLAIQNSGKSQRVRLEIAMYDGGTNDTADPGVLLDSDYLDLELIHDPPELRNPVPDHTFLRQLAAMTGGAEIRSVDELVAALSRIQPASETLLERVPIWDRSWIVMAIVLALAAEWTWRRWLGLV